jgi:hypothetical protein
MSQNDLLRPSLSGDQLPATSIYSAGAGYGAAFFGGPIGAAVIAMLNARRLNRLAKDWPLALLAVLITVGMLWWQLRMGGNAWLEGHLGSSGPRSVPRVAGLLFFGGIYLLHYKYYRNMQLMGIESPSGWVPAIVAVLIGLAITILLTGVLLP